MAKRRNKKRTLLASIISMILCVSMLLGTTMAWFTDTVSNIGNRIVTGNLGLQLLRYEGADYSDISDGQGDIFATEGEAGESILWEPGKTEIVLLQVKNIGNLALNYNIILDVANEGNAPLEEVLSYAVIPNVAGKNVGEANVALYGDLNITGWHSIAGLRGIDTGVVKTGITKAAPNGALLAGKSDYFALAVHMNESAGNAYQNQSIVIDVKVEAKQMPYESDSFGNQYDANAQYKEDILANAITYHVSTTGDDSNDGTEAAPFATIKKANEVISAMNHAGTDVYVMIHGGTYMLTEDIEFNTASGGAGENKVVYKAAGDGEVVFSGYLQIPVSSMSSAVGTTVGGLIPEKVQSQVLKVNLEQFGYDYKDLDLFTDDNGEKKEFESYILMEYFKLLLNGKEQMIAQWPNYGEFETIDEVVNKGATTKAGAEGGNLAKFKVDYLNLANWTAESLEQAVVRGYMTANFREEWNGVKEVDKENETMTLLHHTTYGVAPGRNWKILNLAEELDVPGEFCIDYKHGDLALYWYPPYEVTNSDVLELSVVRGVTLKCVDTQNIVFDGIKFTGFRNSEKEEGVITVKNSDNIEIRNCTFTHNDGGANIVITGKNNMVEACGFYNCGATGVFLNGGGNYTTLEHQKNVISNNHFYNVGQLNAPGSGNVITSNLTNRLQKDTVGNVIKNNLIHRIYGGISIYFDGAEYDISYNEISNGLRNLADIGLIYIGNRPHSLGSTVNYNYLHDFGSLLDSSMEVQAIYFDDWQSGMTANNNIIVGNTDAGTRGIFSVGAYNTIQYNIVANSTVGILQGNRGNTIHNNSVLNSFYNDISTMSDALKNKYPFMLTLQQEIESRDGYFPLIGNVITDNIAFNAPYDINAEAYELSTIEEATAPENAFVDAANHDWRITSAYAQANNLSENIMTEDNFSMDQIGIQKNVWAITNPLESFKQVYPQNGSGDVNPNDITLNWEPALFADEYEYIVAKDSELTDVVVSGTTSYEYVNIGDLVSGETYYWKVTAVNTTRQLGASWDSEEVFSFTVDREIADKRRLIKAIDAAAEVFATVKDGEENKVGDFKIGTEAKLKALLDSAKAVNAKANATQDEVDTEVSKLELAVNGLGAYQYKGYVTLDTSDLSKWQTIATGPQLSVENGVMSATGSARVVSYTENIPNCNMLTFDVKANLSGEGGGYLGLMVRSSEWPINNCWNGLAYYFFIQNNKIELQANETVGKGVILKALPSNDYIMDETWHNIRIETVDLEGGGVEIALYVDNEEVLRHVDTEYMLYGEGTFMVQSGGKDVQIRAVENIPTFTEK